jgi:cytochrome P450
MRRAALNPFFSKQKVRALQPKIETVVENLLARFEEFAVTKKPLPMSDAFAALTYGTSPRSNNSD